MKRVFVFTLGCPKNEVDSLIIKEHLKSSGFAVVDDARLCDVVVVNTCAFIEEAKKESVETIFSFLQSGRDVVVAGCLYQRYKNRLVELLPEVRGFLSLSHLRDLPKYLEERKFYTPCDMSVLPNSDDFKFYEPEHLWTYVKIAEGCSNRCNYCVIPSIRGPYRSRDLSDVMDEVKLWLDKGIKELNLISQDTASYGNDKGFSLIKLLEELEKIEGDFWVRLLYLHPAHFDRNIAEFIASSKKCVSYVEMPFQHINENVLSLMGRKGGKDAVIEASSLCREYNLFLRTTFLVGHPGETEEAFEELLNFVLDLRPWRACVFPYSCEEGTLSFSMEQLKESIIIERANVLSETLERIMFEETSQLKGRRLKALLEGTVGRIEYQAPEIDGELFVDEEKYGLFEVLVEDSIGLDVEAKVCKN